MPILHRESVPCHTADGLHLALRRVREGRNGTSRGSVVLLHGLASSGDAFDLPGRSLAERLAQLGFDCFVPQLRGAGTSDRPRSGYGVDEYIELDLPAIFDAVREASGRERMSWVGHSMGGILAMFYAMEHADAPISRLVAVGTALDYSSGPSVFGELRRLLPYVQRLLPALPFDRLARLNSRVAGRGPTLLPEQINFWRDNVEREVMRSVLAHDFTPVPWRLLADLDTTYGPDGFARKRGALAYRPLSQAYRIPSCLIAGSRDRQCPAGSVEATARALRGAAEIEVVVFGRPYGQAQEYGHYDLLIGRHASSEVWPTLENFLLRSVPS